MRNEVTLKIILENPATGVDYGLQQGKGIEFKTIQIKRGSLESLEFECSVKVKFSDNNTPVFLGSYAQGPARTGSCILILEHLRDKKILVGIGV